MKFDGVQSLISTEKKRKTYKIHTFTLCNQRKEHTYLRSNYLIELTLKTNCLVHYAAAYLMQFSLKYCKIRYRRACNHMLSMFKLLLMLMFVLYVFKVKHALKLWFSCKFMAFIGETTLSVYLVLILLQFVTHKCISVCK